MIFTKAIEYETIKNNIDKDNDVITIIGCETCVRVAGSGGAEKMKDLALKLRGEGYHVKDGFMVPTVCNPKIYFAKLSRNVNTIIALACEAGYSNIIRTHPDKKVIEAVEDVGLMVTDTDKKIIKVTMPYKKSEDTIGKEYEVGTGNKTDSDHVLPIMEV